MQTYGPGSEFVLLSAWLLGGLESLISWPEVVPDCVQVVKDHRLTQQAWHSLPNVSGGWTMWKLLTIIIITFLTYIE